ncbi:2,4-dienoyl-CoA reductase-like NADH-dependent reductase (Old Yellow Enzyme family) [Panacagrimonas perspica]|uniref:2,4-dienoyl-CoA reductase-like NADH-dependent reductase (Old Yellow Enzyme family) n=1 Tax=Panacagrimonas perspica TaxID=381431 RepID=A0A4R7PGB2_9GAMM|nr:NADH:flavin oxidoreductase/NADH oxidase family protein [Panacagrimonas perspica]TDU32691.1 2,4-dienoyl-CoA reductase-like NADH-dependent reductase (Old Yellow Enzyme family) [Panacagrimonas perspica]THD05576.1 NADH:flavin oxidoreductase [Panacagrimonas perspica]
MTDLLSRPLKLPCGATLSNRLAKAPLTEGLADEHNRANEKLVRLYECWSEGGAGLLVSGNVHVDRRYLERPGNVAIDNNGGLEWIRAYAKAGTRAGNHFWMQINHPGRQGAVTRDGTFPAPSAISLNVPGRPEFVPRVMPEEEILDVIRRFAFVATTARECGFTGVQVHSAHGYLLSSFLSGLSNTRTDAWGGSLRNRARALLETVRAVRKAVGPDFPVSVKLNSSDFQKGGFTNEECLEVVRWLGEEKIDLLEITGGNYEQLPWLEDVKPSTQRREGYFLDYAKQIRTVATMPLMITGGMRTRGGMEEALRSGGMDVIGLGRPMCVDTDICKRLLAGDTDAAVSYEGALPVDPREIAAGATDDEAKALEMWTNLVWFFVQIWRIGEGQGPKADMTALEAYRIYRETEDRQTAMLAPL